MIKERWEAEVFGSPQFVSETKLKNVRKKIKTWAWEEALRDKKQKSELQDQLEKWNKENESQQVTEQDKAQEIEMYEALY